jgi:hypothetical protein
VPFKLALKGHRNLEGHRVLEEASKFEGAIERASTTCRLPEITDGRDVPPLLARSRLPSTPA